MTPTPQDTRDFIIIADEKRKKLFSPKQETDEVWAPSTGGWITTPYPNTEFLAVDKYRRHRSRAWLRIADKPVEWPAWLRDQSNNRLWVESQEHYDITPMTAVEWQPADPAPDAPVDELSDYEKLVAFDFFMSAWTKGVDAKVLLADAIAEGKRKGREYERMKK